VDTIPAPPDFHLDERRQAVAEETLRRPPLPVSVPGHCAHLVFLTTPAEADRHRLHMLRLIENWSGRLELDRHDQIIAATASLTLKWERHTEFCSITMISNGPSSLPESDPALAHWPPLGSEWSRDCPGRLMVALKAVVEPRDTELFASDFVASRGSLRRLASTVAGGAARVETSYAPADDGYLHLRIRSSDTDEGSNGRLLQRLLEIETYRVLALMAWPDVQAAGPRLNEIDAGVTSLTEELGQMPEGEDRSLLLRLTALARQLEHITAQTHFRFNASLAYSDLVQRRLDDLREERVEGEQRISGFINRRLSPAARTYRAILNRQVEMSERVSRTSGLLRSRMDVELAHQNQQLLASMERRARQQLRLQETVEGLSVVAISYYAIGILSYLVSPFDSAIPGVSGKLLLGLLAPFVVLAVFLIIRRVRKGFGHE